jgi:hypothetical protein
MISRFNSSVCRRLDAIAKICCEGTLCGIFNGKNENGIGLLPNTSASSSSYLTAQLDILSAIIRNTGHVPIMSRTASEIQSQTITRMITTNKKSSTIVAPWHRIPREIRMFVSFSVMKV